MRIPRLLFTATFRLVSLYLLLFVFSVGALSTLFFWTMRGALDDEARTQIATEANLLLFEYREDGIDELLEETEERIEKNEPGQRLRYMVQGPDGRVVFDRDVPPPPREGWQRSGGGMPRLWLFTPLGNGYVLGVGKDLAGLAGMQKAFTQALAWALGAVLVIGVAGGLILSRRTLAQIEHITRAARAIGDGTLSQRIATRGTGDEFDDLALTLNRMLDRIETLVANVRDVSAGIAHDLRTPLARLRNRIESTRAAAPPGQIQDELGSAIEEVDDVLQTFAALLRLAELQSGALKKGFGPVDLTTLVREVVEMYEPLTEEREVAIESAIGTLVEVKGDAHLLRQLLANLIENALEHGGRGIRLSVRLHTHHDGAVLEVADTGPGIPPDARERVIKPFERLDPGQRGSGLGLALVAAIASLHDARFELLDNAPGLRCRVTFPR